MNKITMPEQLPIEHVLELCFVHRRTSSLTADITRCHNGKR